MAKNMALLGAGLGLLGGMAEWLSTVVRPHPATVSEAAQDAWYYGVWFDRLLLAPLLLGPLILLVALVLRRRPRGSARVVVGRSLLLLATSLTPVVLGAVLAGILLTVAPSDACRDWCGFMTYVLAGNGALLIGALAAVGALLQADYRRGQPGEPASVQSSSAPHRLGV